MSEPVSERVDVAIVGGGPAGLAAGVTAALRGLSHIIFERGHLAHTIHRYQKGKHVMAEPERLPLHESLPLAFDEGSREEVLGRWQSDVERGRANLRLGPEWEVTAIEGAKGDFRLTLRGGQKVQASSVVLAIGVQGNLRTFGVPGQELPHVSYQLDDPGAFEDKRVVVVGVGDAGIENALALMENGNDVAIVNRRDEFDRAKARNRALIESAIRSGQIAYYPNSETERFEPGKIVLRGPGGETVLPADLVIGRLGAIPPRKFLDGLGVAFPSADPAAVPRVSDSYEASVPGLFLIGAVVGYPLIKNCMNQGFEVIEHLAGNPVTPADEPILREKFAGVPGSVSEIVERIRSRVPLFSKLTPIQLREFLVDSELRSLPVGQTLFERNDYSTEFYSIVEGEVEIAFPASDADRDSDRRPGAGSERRVVFGPGAFFGEGSLISGRRRAGTAASRTAAVVVETPRSRMNSLINSSEDVRRVLDSAFIARRLGDLFPGVDAAERQALADAAVQQTFKEGDVLFSEGDAPDGLHVIRRGSVAILRRFQGRDLVMNYVPAGNYLGELGLVSRARRRSATARAAAFTQTIRLPAEVMDGFLERHPDVRRQWEEREEELRAQDVVIGAEAGTETSSLLEFFMRAGGKEATDILVIDESLCVRCDNCEKACAETHQGVSRLDREGGTYFGSLHLPKACQHCEHPKCMDDCPPDALRRHPDGEVYVMENCIGCGNCVSNCPYGVIQLAHVEEKARRNVLFRLLFGERSGAAAGKETKGEKKAVKCDLCRNLPEPRSGRKAAACVASCPTGAILRVSPREFIDAVRAGEPEPVALPSSFLGADGWRWLKASGAILLAALVLYVAYDPIGGRSGDSAVGYALGVASALLILWLLWFAVRKRSYASRGQELQGWLSAHVWLGLTLLVLVPLHSAFQFGWNVHTLAYLLLVVVVLSGICGVLAYAAVPQLMTRNRGGRRFDAFLEEIADVDADCRNLAGDLPDVVSQAVAVAIDETKIGGGVLRQLSGHDPHCGTARALAELREVSVAAGSREQLNRLIELLARKGVLLDTLRRDLRHQALLDLWLLVHVPLSLATLAAVVVHVFSVFWYW